MLAVHKKYKAFVKELFSGDQSFMGALDKACSSVINHKFDPKMPSKSPEYVSSRGELCRFQIAQYPSLVFLRWLP
jgi:Cullin, a subunit of E3 ubiquitin ligase